MDHPLQETKESRAKEPVALEVQSQPPPSQHLQHTHNHQQQPQQSESPQQQTQQQQVPPPASSQNSTATSNGNGDGSQSGSTTVTNILSGQRPRMITASGQIREIPEAHIHSHAQQQQQEQQEQQQQAAEQYERQQQQQQSNEYHQQIVQENATYATYENPPVSAANVTEVKTVQIAHGRVPEREKSANGHMAPGQTVYVVRDNEEHYYRAPHPMRYENERFQRYHQYLAPSVKTELDVQSQNHQSGQQIIYETESGETVVTETTQQEAKAQYTNLEPMQNISSSQGYIFPPGYSSGNVTYLPPAKEEYYIQGSPNPVLYKSK